MSTHSTAVGEINFNVRILLWSHIIAGHILRELLGDLTDVFDAHRIRLGQARYVHNLVLVYFS